MNMYETIADFYAGKSVLITGGTGFLGKVILEKLLYSCPDIDKIYVLIRDQKELNASQRLQKLLDNPLYTRLIEQRPNALKKLVPIRGDISLPNLGMNAQDELDLIEKVSVVIHTAATVKFNEPLKLALKMNVEGTQKILELCHRMKKLEALVHTSTAYANTDELVHEEMIYPPPAELDDVYAFLKQEDHEQNNDILNGRPNTYTFTKALAENLVSKHHGNIPTSIVRPSIVTPIIQDPVPGWVCNWFGATGFVTSVSKGLIRALYSDPKNIIDLIPVDFVANLIIIAAAKSERSKGLAVYNCCSGDCNPVTYGYFFKQYVKVTMEHKTHVLPRPDLFIMTKNHWYLSLFSILSETVPAYFMDFWMLLQGKQTRFVKNSNRLKLNRDSITFFSSRSWIMKTERARALAASLSPEDRKQFPFNPQDINWKEYIPVYYAGVCQFLEKSTAPSNKRNITVSKL